MALPIHLVEQVDVIGQLLHRVLHLIFQLLLLHRTSASSKSGPYRSEINGRVMRPDYRQGMGHGGHSGVMVEAFEVLPRRLTPVDDGVRTRRPVIGLRSCLDVNAVKH